jgi:hypothetical protein
VTRPATRVLVLRFEVQESCELTDGQLEDLAEQIVAQQIDPDPPVLTWDGSEVVREWRG